MKKLLTLFMVILLFVCSNGQEKSNQKPIIKSEKTTYHEIDGSSVKESVNHRGFDCLAEYNTDSTLSKETFLAFDDKMNKKVIFYTNIYHYEGTKLIKIEMIISDNEKKEIGYTYDDQLQLIKKEENSFIDKKLVLVDLASIYSDYLNSENEQVEKMYQYDGDKKEFVLVSNIHRKYDNKKNIIESREQIEPDNVETMNITYNENNKPVELKYSPTNMKFNFEYDNKGNVTTELAYLDETVQTTHRSYKYDRYGNWIEQKVIIKRNPESTLDGQFLIRRKIEYY